MSAFGMNPTFNEPQTDDDTSAPQVQIPSVQQPMGQKKKKKGFTARPSGALAGAIARAKRPRQQGDKWGA